MKLQNNVKAKRFWWNLIPVLTKYTANAIYPNIYLPKEVYLNLSSKNPKPKYVSVLLHEQEHIRRQKKMGWFKWGIKYVFNPKFRFDEELAAIKSSMKYLKKKGVKVDLERKARILLGYLYLWPVKYEVALKRLKTVWEEV